MIYIVIIYIGLVGENRCKTFVKSRIPSILASERLHSVTGGCCREEESSFWLLISREQVPQPASHNSAIESWNVQYIAAVYRTVELRSAVRCAVTTLHAHQ